VLIGSIGETRRMVREMGDGCGKDRRIEKENGIKEE